jgi:hypothetical protein
MEHESLDYEMVMDDGSAGATDCGDHAWTATRFDPAVWPKLMDAAAESISSVEVGRP